MKTHVVKVDKRVRRTQKLLKHAFIQLMADKNYEQITVTDIVEYADYNRATFYRHYNYKEELVEEIISDQTKSLIQAFRYPYTKNNYIHLHSLSPSQILIFTHIIENKDFYKRWDKFETIPGFQESFIESLTQFFKNEIVFNDKS